MDRFNTLFKRSQSQPKDHDARTTRNFRIWFAVVCFGLMGAARGLDEGLIGTTTAQPSFVALFKLKDPALSASARAERLSNITAMVQAGCIPGALFAFFVTDKIGRIWAARQLIVWWVVGVAIYMGAAANGSLGMVYGGRFIMGMGIGQTAVVAPTYLAEVAPKSIRGMCVTTFSGASFLGIMIGYFASYGCSLHISNTDQAQWLIPTSIHLYLAAIIMTLTFFGLESPRWLIKTGQHQRATENLAKLRGLPIDDVAIANELLEVRDSLEREREATLGTTRWAPLRELLFIPANQYRLYLTIGIQLLGQWSGSGAITVYAPQFFALVGVSGSSEGLLATGILGVVKFVSALICSIFLIDFIGRKRSLMTGISIQAVAMTYMALFLTIDPHVATAPQSPSQKRASTGAIAMIYFSGFGWAMGWNTVQYLINAEMYPLRLRALGSSIAMTVHFACQYGASKATPEMFVSLTKMGTMWFFSAVTIVGLIWVWFFLPETSRRSLESLDAMFDLPWYEIGRKGKAFLAEQEALTSEEVRSEKV